MLSPRLGRPIRIAPAVWSRRAVLRALAVVSGFTAVHAPELLGAKGTDKSKGKTRLKRNQLGCVNVGGATCLPPGID